MSSGAENIRERLDNLKALIQTEDFLEGKGLGNEINIRLFCYDPKDEMTVRYFIKQIMSDGTKKCRVIERNMYKLFIELCEDMDILDAVPDMEECDGSEFLLEQLHGVISGSEYIDKFILEDKQPGNDVVILTGVGSVYPYMRVHKMLDELQPFFTDIPVIVFYPGEFNGRELQLFGKLEPNPYYRAFNII